MKKNKTNENIDKRKLWERIVKDVEEIPFEDRDDTTLLKVASAFNNLGNYRDALENLEKIEDKETSDKDLKFYKEMGTALGRLERYEEALPYFYKYFEEEENDIQAYYEFACILGRFGRNEEAIKYLNKIDKYKGQKIDLILFCSEMGWNLIQLERYEEALKYLRIMEQAGRNDIWSNTQLGLTYIGIGEIYVGLNYLFLAEELSLTEDEENPYLLSQIGLILGSIGKNKEALEYFARAQSMGREDGWLYSQIGFNLGQLGNYEEALKFLLKAVKYEREGAWIFSQIGWCLNKLEKYKKALTYLRKAEKISEKDYWLFYQLGVAYKGQEKYKKALEYFKKIPNEVDFIGFVYLNIAEIYGKIGNKENGIEYLRKIGDNFQSDDPEFLKKYEEVENILIETQEFLF